ncbi:hypothetical protein EDB85DRAFT_1967210 [Lactarius pseudohatsudake]|nr:hypothetical protein EDB85DRAFT_1967210 [Lactarius pseudohatsudake]
MASTVRGVTSASWAFPQHLAEAASAPTPFLPRAAKLLVGWKPGGRMTRGSLRGRFRCFRSIVTVTCGQAGSCRMHPPLQVHGGAYYMSLGFVYIVCHKLLHHRMCKVLMSYCKVSIRHPTNCLADIHYSFMAAFGSPGSPYYVLPSATYVPHSTHHSIQ